MKVRAAILTAACVIAWLTSPGSASWLLGRAWSGPDIVMDLQLGPISGTLIDGTTSWGQVSEHALSQWNSNLFNVSFSVRRDSTAARTQLNNINNVYWDGDVYGDSFGDAIATAVTWSSGGVISESDVIFNNAHSWNSYRGDLRSASGGGTLYDFRRVALHEFGHVLGLGHPDENGQSVTAIMNSQTSNIDRLQTDDIAGAQAIYGSAGDTLLAGARLLPGQALTSTGGGYRLVYETNGDLVLYAGTTAEWSSGTSNTSAGSATMQSDGNFVVYDAQGAPAWFTGTGGNPNAQLVLQSDGNLVVYSAAGQALWDRRSASTPAPTPTPTPTPTPGATSVIREASVSLGSRTRRTVTFATTAAGTIGATINWTFAANDVDLYLSQGTNPCSIDQFNNDECQFLGSATSASTKPETLSVSNLAAGPYTLYLVNWGATDDSVGYQITLTSLSGASAFSLLSTSPDDIEVLPVRSTDPVRKR